AEYFPAGPGWQFPPKWALPGHSACRIGCARPAHGRTPEKHDRSPDRSVNQSQPTRGLAQQSSRNVPHREPSYARPNCSLAAATPYLGVKPNFLIRSLRGADAPKERMPMLCPVAPTYLAQPKVEACSTETRAFTSGGNTRSRYSRGWSSNSSHDGMLTTRALI